MRRMFYYVFLVLSMLVIAVPALLPCGTPTARAQDGDPGQAAQALIDSLAAGDFVSPTASFDSALQQSMPPETLEELWNWVISQAGAYLSPLGVENQSTDDLTRVVVMLQFEQAVIGVEVTFNAEGLISGLSFVPSVDEAPSADAEAIAVDFVSRLTAGDFAGATVNFDGNMQQMMPPESLQELWNSLTAQVGTFQSALGIGHEPVQGYMIVLLDLQFAHYIVQIQVTVNAQSQISGLSFVPGEPVAAPPADPEAVATAFADRLSSGDFAGAVALFDAQMQQTMSPQGLQDLWASLVAQVGAFQGRLGVGSQPVDNYTVVLVGMQFEAGPIALQVTINAQGQISGASFVPTEGLTPVNDEPALETESAVAVAQSLVNSLIQADFAGATANFDDNMRGVLSPDMLQEYWNTVLAEAGAFGQAEGGNTWETQGYVVVDLLLGFERTTVTIRVAVNAAGQVAGFSMELDTGTVKARYEPPAYVDQAAFNEIQVTIGQGEWLLPGTLSLPVGEGPFPVVILVHGAGPKDRDGSLGANKPFRDLAWGLASRGIAVLRYDKRTLVHHDRLVNERYDRDLTVQQEVIDDALAAAVFLNNNENIDASRIYVLGYGHGGYLVPRIASQELSLAGAIILAGYTRPIEDVLLSQKEYVQNLDGELSQEEQDDLAAAQEAASTIKTLDASHDPAERYFGAPVSYWLDLQTYDPISIAQLIPQPLLVLQGERDYQVTMVDFQNWQNGLAARDNVTFISYPGLNHQFVAGEGASSPADYGVIGHVSETVVSDIVNWIMSR
ncbi:MAG: DUF3887 domain-containing protein [Anaerolineae bacterium]|nr:DUF3887 domain-containing protein [Anaerolineae bacterium]